MKRKILYYSSYHGSDCPPSICTIFLNRIFFCCHVPRVRIWSIEFLFKNANLELDKFIKPLALPYKGDKVNYLKLGKLQGIRLRLGKPMVTICFSKSWGKRYLDSIERNQIPLNFFEIKETERNGVKWYILYFKYCFTDRGLHYYHEPNYILEYKDNPPPIKEIYRQFMLSDFTRWNRYLNETDVVEISECVYDYLLEVLPPRNWRGAYFEVDECNYHDSNGRAIYRACIKKNDKYYTGHPDAIKAMNTESK